jgi:hypothetical protein
LERWRGRVSWDAGRHARLEPKTGGDTPGLSVRMGGTAGLSVRRGLWCFIDGEAMDGE